MITSWLLDLAAGAFVDDPNLEGFSNKVSDSGEGRWTFQAAIDEGVPAPILAVALASRFSSRGADDFGNRILGSSWSDFGRAG